MRSLFRLVAALMLACIVLSLLGGGAVLHEIWHDGVEITVNGETLVGPGSAFDGLETLIGLGVTAIVLAVVLPLVLMFSIGLPLLIVGGLVAALLGAGALVCSPLLLFLVLLVWLLRRQKPRRATRRNQPNIVA